MSLKISNKIFRNIKPSDKIFMYCPEILCEHEGCNTITLYSYIYNTTDKKKGYCCKTNKHFENKFNCSSSTVKRVLRKLIDLRVVYINSFQLKWDTVRHLIVKDHSYRYLTNVLKGDCVPESVKKDFCDNFLE
ncbi:hypothetical protein KY321_03975 [Candidatus Woesearchaeota archaeon]|nr:hypothetical protein [Candidatus Woesearchaeota archaeon]